MGPMHITSSPNQENEAHKGHFAVLQKGKPTRAFQQPWTSEEWMEHQNPDLTLILEEREVGPKLVGKEPKGKWNPTPHQIRKSD